MRGKKKKNHRSCRAHPPRRRYCAITVNYSPFQCAQTAAGSERHVQVHSARAAPNCLLFGTREPSARDQSIQSQPGWERRIMHGMKKKLFRYKNENEKKKNPLVRMHEEPRFLPLARILHMFSFAYNSPRRCGATVTRRRCSGDAANWCAHDQINRLLRETQLRSNPEVSPACFPDSLSDKNKGARRKDFFIKKKNNREVTTSYR